MLCLLIGPDGFGEGDGLGLTCFLTRRVAPWPALNELIASENARDLRYQIVLGSDGISSHAHYLWPSDEPVLQIERSLRESTDVYSQMSDRLHRISRKGYLHGYRQPNEWESQAVDDFKPIFGVSPSST